MRLTHHTLRMWSQLHGCEFEVKGGSELKTEAAEKIRVPNPWRTWVAGRCGCQFEVFSDGSAGWNRCERHKLREECDYIPLRYASGSGNPFRDDPISAMDERPAAPATSEEPDGRTNWKEEADNLRNQLLLTQRRLRRCNANFQDLSVTLQMLFRVIQRLCNG